MGQATFLPRGGLTSLAPEASGFPAGMVPSTRATCVALAQDRLRRDDSAGRSSERFRHSGRGA